MICSPPALRATEPPVTFFKSSSLSSVAVVGTGTAGVFRSFFGVFMLFLSLLTFWFFLSFMRDSFCLHIVSWLLARDKNTTERNDDTWLLKLSLPGKQANSVACTGSLARQSRVMATFLRMRASTLMRPLRRSGSGSSRMRPTRKLGSLGIYVQHFV